MAKEPGSLQPELVVADMAKESGSSQSELVVADMMNIGKRVQITDMAKIHIYVKLRENEEGVVKTGVSLSW